MISPGNLNGVCYCPNLCLSDDPIDSTEAPFEGTPYNRRIDCSCKRRWPGCLDYDLSAREYARTIAMRARDVGRPIAAEHVLELFSEIEKYIDEL